MAFQNSFPMIRFLGIFLLCLSGANGEDEDLKFPDDFMIGVATASYQIEGGWNASDKGESVWDRYVHTQPDRILNRDTGDVACDSYHKYKEDVQLLKELGVNHYRFSISWPRILPNGYANKISADGLKYYHNLLDELEKYNITPMVTIYHWDHPQIFQDIGGWTNEALVDLFGDYARVVYKEFAHRVKYFITINEPNSVCKDGYYTGLNAPGFKLGRSAEYLCTHNILKAHAVAYHIYNEKFKKKFQGQVGIVIDCYHHYAKYENDTLSPQIGFQFDCGRYGHPIFSDGGDYPALLKKMIAENSQFEGLPRSRLPIFSKKWIEYIKGTADFFGLNHYSTFLVEPAPRPKNTIYLEDNGIIYGWDPKWPSTQTKNIKIVPEGLRDLLRKIKIEYRNPPVYITENGMSDFGCLKDFQRIEYLHSYMKAMLEAIKEYHCNVKGYTAWSLMDNFEWDRGYSAKFGIIHVDFNSPNRTRTLKRSATWLSSILRARKLLPVP